MEFRFSYLGRIALLLRHGFQTDDHENGNYLHEVPVTLVVRAEVSI
jgi:hypothetical protein